MKDNHYLSLLALTLSTFFLFEASICRGDLMFNVTLDTSGLVGHPAGPFYIDFQLNDGSSSFARGINTATISAFTFGEGGKPTGSPNLFGGAQGNLTTSVTLTDDTAFYNEFFQSFTPGSILSFSVSLTARVDPGETPDAFSFSILDSLLSPIPTTNFADAFLFININSIKLTYLDLPDSIFAGDPTRPPLAGGDPISIGKPQIPRAPETGSSFSMLLMGLGAVWCLRRGFLCLDRHSPIGWGGSGDAGHNVETPSSYEA